MTKKPPDYICDLIIGHLSHSFPFLLFQQLVTHACSNSIAGSDDRNMNIIPLFCHQFVILLCDNHNKKKEAGRNESALLHICSR
jgi:hypothetical protein